MHCCKNVIYTYDGTFNGLLCCVFESVYEKELPVNIKCEGEEDLTFYINKNIPTSEERAKRVYLSIEEKIGSKASELVKTVFLSCVKEKELTILCFLLFVYKKGKNVLSMVSHKYVSPMLQAQRALKSEVHKFKGFIRFTDYDGVLVAHISPKNNILLFLKNYFCARYEETDFLIYDNTHNLALVYEQGNANIIYIESISMPKESNKEIEFKQLWLKYYKTVAIEARKNEKCRLTLMPKRYWVNILEVADEL